MSYTDDDLKRIAGIKDDQFDSRISGLLESIDTLLDRRLSPIETAIGDLQTDIKIVKAAVTDTSRQVHDHERRMTQLEAGA